MKVGEFNRNYTSLIASSVLGRTTLKLLCNLSIANLKITSLILTTNIPNSVQVPVPKLYSFHLAPLLPVRESLLGSR